MNNKDKLQRFLFENASIRGELVHLDTSYDTIASQHGYPPVIKKLLGEALVLVSLLSAIVKFTGKVTIQFQSKSRLKLLLVQSTQELHLRGLAQWAGELDEIDLLEDLKKGVLIIMMDPEDSANRYQGIVAWEGNSLARSVEGYFRNSEQLLTRIWIAVDETRAAGLLLQAMPESEAQQTESTTTTVAQDWEHLIHLTETVTPEELLNLDNETLLYRLYSQEEVRFFEPSPVIFQCSCSAKRSENAILILGRDEADEELQEKQAIVVICDFCNKEYIFDRVDVENIFRHGDNPSDPTKLH